MIKKFVDDSQKGRWVWHLDFSILISLLEIVMNEMRKLMMSANFFANTSHDICRSSEV